MFEINRGMPMICMRTIGDFASNDARERTKSADMHWANNFYENPDEIAALLEEGGNVVYPELEETYNFCSLMCHQQPQTEYTLKTKKLYYNQYNWNQGWVALVSLNKDKSTNRIQICNVTDNPPEAGLIPPHRVHHVHEFEYNSLLLINTKHIVWNLQEVTRTKTPGDSQAYAQIMFL